MRTITKTIEIPELGDIVYDWDAEKKGKITQDGHYGEVFEIEMDNGDFEEITFDQLNWDSRNNWWEINN